MTNIVDPACTPDLFCSNLVQREQLGPCTRLTFAVARKTDDIDELFVVARIILPTELADKLLRSDQVAIATQLAAAEAPQNQPLN